MDRPSITCPQCHMTSYHPRDIEARYCGHCCGFHSHMFMARMGELEMSVDEVAFLAGMSRVQALMAIVDGPEPDCLADVTDVLWPKEELSTSAWQMVTCKQCARLYRCTPADDYYNATNDHDGVCEPCLVGDLPVQTVIVDPATFAALRRAADDVS